MDSPNTVSVEWICKTHICSQLQTQACHSSLSARGMCGTEIKLGLDLRLDLCFLRVSVLLNEEVILPVSCGRDGEMKAVLAEM